MHCFSPALPCTVPWQAVLTTLVGARLAGEAGLAVMETRLSLLPPVSTASLAYFAYDLCSLGYLANKVGFTIIIFIYERESFHYYEDLIIRI